MATAKKDIQFKRVNGVLYLLVGGDESVGFREDWLAHLAGMPNLDFPQCMQYMRDTVMPLMTKKDKTLLAKADLRQLPKAIQAFVAVDTGD
ncbi:MAG: hypothetical protein NTU94_03735 [Planctomycetota bacterium]|nr:hypothetical protein [Planctomycetota bacterium]